MSVVYSSVSSASQLYVQKKINALVHQGKANGQLVLSSETCINAIKIDGLSRDCWRKRSIFLIIKL